MQVIWVERVVRDSSTTASSYMTEQDPGQTQLRLGIDTGGTYTDAALVDAENQVLASGKSLTTHSQLETGIRAVLKKLPADLLY